MNSYAKWRKIIDDRYGSLDKFDDARTVRTMLRGRLLQIEIDAAIRATLKNDEQRAIWDAALGEDDKVNKAAVEELSAWLSAKGLTL